MKIIRKIKSVIAAALMCSSYLCYNLDVKADDTAANAAKRANTADGGFSADEIACSPVKPTLTLTKKVVSLDDAGKTHQIDVMVSGADAKYCTTGFHVEYDPRIQVNLDAVGNVDATTQESLFGFAKLNEYDDKKALFLSTAATENYGMDGVLWSFNVTLPSDAKLGDVYYFDIVYRNTATGSPLFVGKEVTAEEKLMCAYTFTQGIYNEEYNNNFKADEDDIGECPALAEIPAYIDGYIAIGGYCDCGNHVTANSLGDINSDGAVDSSDASAVLVEYAAMSIGGATTLTEMQKKAADVNSDGAADASDASKILEFYAYCSTGGKETDMQKWLDANK